jgi:hypothetical protein
VAPAKEGEICDIKHKIADNSSSDDSNDEDYDEDYNDLNNTATSEIRH